MSIARALASGARTITTGRQLIGQFDGTTENALLLATHVGPNALLRLADYPAPGADSVGPLTQIALPEGYTGWRADTTNPQEWNLNDYWETTTQAYVYSNELSNLGGIIGDGGAVIDGFAYEAGTQVYQFMDFSLGAFSLIESPYGWPIVFRGCRWRAASANAPGPFNNSGNNNPLAFHFCDLGAVGAEDAEICEVAVDVNGPCDGVRVFRCHISYAGAGLQLNNATGYCDAIENWIEKLTFFYGETGPPDQDPLHLNGITLNGGNPNVLIRRNHIVTAATDEGGNTVNQTDCISLFQDTTGTDAFPGTGTNSDGSTGYQITGNYLGGTGYCIYPGVSGASFTGQQPAGVNLQGNLITTTVYPVLSLSGAPGLGGGYDGPIYPGVTWGSNANTASGNLWADGQYAGLPVGAFVQHVAGYAAGASSIVTDIATAAGDTLLAGITAYVSSDTPIAIASVTDSAGNTWNYSTATVSQSPPANGSWDAGQGVYGFAAWAWCANAAAVTSVTVTMSGTATDALCADVIELSYLGAATLDAAASAGTLDSSVTSYATPSVTTSHNGGLVAACSARSSGWSGASPSSFTLLSGGDVNPVIAMNTTAGSWQATFTGSSQDGMATAILALAPGP